MGVLLIVGPIVCQRRCSLATWRGTMLRGMLCRDVVLCNVLCRDVMLLLLLLLPWALELAGCVLRRCPSLSPCVLLRASLPPCVLL